MEHSSPESPHGQEAFDDDQEPLYGYPKLARLMAASPELAMFRQFRELQMMNLLWLQAKLQELEKEYHDVRAEDATSGDQTRINLANDFRQMRDVAESEYGESEQYDLLEKIQATLKEYSKQCLMHCHCRKIRLGRRSDGAGDAHRQNPDSREE